MKKWKIVYWLNGNKKVKIIEAETKVKAICILLFNNDCDGLDSAHEVTDDV